MNNETLVINKNDLHVAIERTRKKRGESKNTSITYATLFDILTNAHQRHVFRESVFEEVSRLDEAWGTLDSTDNT